MEKLTKTQIKVLEVMRDEQCREPWQEDAKQEYRLGDEYHLFIYKGLEADTGFNRTQLRRAMLDMKRRGIVELSVAVDIEFYTPKGSGYQLTKKGVEIINAVMPYKTDAN